MSSNWGTSITKITSLSATTLASSGEAAWALRSTPSAAADCRAVGCGGFPGTAAKPADEIDTAPPFAAYRATSAAANGLRMMLPWQTMSTREADRRVVTNAPGLRRILRSEERRVGKE